MSLRLALAVALALVPLTSASAPQEVRYKGKCVSNPPVDSMMKGRVPVADVTIAKCDTMAVRGRIAGFSFYRGEALAYTFTGHFDQPSEMIVDEITIGDAAPMRVEGGTCAAYGKLPGPMLTTCTADWHADGKPKGVVVLFEVKKLIRPAG